MQTSLGVMGSASEVGRPETAQTLIEKAESLARAIAKRKVLLFTGATTGVVYLVGKTAHDEGAFHIGVSPAINQQEHVDQYKLTRSLANVFPYSEDDEHLVLLHVSIS